MNAVSTAALKSSRGVVQRGLTILRNFLLKLIFFKKKPVVQQSGALNNKDLWQSAVSSIIE